ncbi:MAG TPA: hypothetical protein PK178_11350 [Smithellaceae bacterium]|nr:hypothetical protein [Smithellaceae bacterium]
MTKPVAPRKSDVQSKLAYAKHRHQELMSALFAAKKSATDPAFLVHSCADIISSVRECFDYLGQDIIAEYVIPKTTNTKTLTAYANGTLRAYFPYFQGQLTKADSIFHELKSHTPTLYQDLLDFTNRISAKATIPVTLFNYQMLADIRDMVNEKKHDKLLAVVSEADGEYLIENSAVSMIIPIKAQKGWSSFAVEPGTRVERVAEYRFAHNDQEVGEFCLFATNATERVIGSFYADHFA